MKPAAFEYLRPTSLQAALAALSQGDKDAQLMAGGQSLVAMMNLRVVAPERVIDIGRLEELRRVSETADQVRLGAGTTHAAIEDGVVPDPSRGLMPAVAANLAYRAVRTRGTIGGSLALADPAADWPTVMAALDAKIILRSSDGVREVAAWTFVTGIYETARRPDEVLEAISIPKLSEAANWGFHKFTRKTGEFAHSMAAAVHDPVRQYARVVLGAVGGPPLLLASTSALLSEGNGARHSWDEAIASDIAAGGLDFDDYQQSLHRSTALRALRQLTSKLAAAG